MRARVLFVAGLTIAAFALTGCPKKNGECDNTDDCKSQQGYESDVCVDHKCQECGADSDCKAGFLCQANRCVPKPECSKNEDCGAGKTCSAGKCVASNTCNSNADCPAGKCLGGQCRPSNACITTKDCNGGETCEQGTCTAPSQCQLERVHFGFNESNLDDSAQTTLKNDAECIQKRKLSVELQGNADERGTEEYNLHLGERRAASVKKYLQGLGVESGKMKTISFGEEHPVNPGHDEGAWAENRRVDIVEK